MNYRFLYLFVIVFQLFVSDYAAASRSIPAPAWKMVLYSQAAKWPATEQECQIGHGDISKHHATRKCYDLRHSCGQHLDLVADNRRQTSPIYCLPGLWPFASPQCCLHHEERSGLMANQRSVAVPPPAL